MGAEQGRKSRARTPFGASVFEGRWRNWPVSAKSSLCSKQVISGLCGSMLPAVTRGQKVLARED